MKEETQLYGGKMTFSQAGDCCNGGHQEMEIEVLDGGGGKYFILKTESWAFDTIEEFAAIIEKVKKAFMGNESNVGKSDE